MSVKKVYWDTSCFISFLSSSHPEETTRAAICEDILNHAKDGKIELWTSVWTMVETIRPKAPVPNSFAPPSWAIALDAVNSNGDLIYPDGKRQFATMWQYYNRATLPTRMLTEAESQRIKGMFEWPWIKKIDVVPNIALKAADIARARNMRPGDSIHVASALARQCDVLHRWDRDYKRTDELIPSEEPKRMSAQNLLDGLS